MKRCKWCERGWYPNGNGHHIFDVSRKHRRPTIEIAVCPNFKPLDSSEDIEMTYEKLGRTYEEL